MASNTDLELVPVTPNGSNLELVPLGQPKFDPMTGKVLNRTPEDLNRAAVQSGSYLTQIPRIAGAAASIPGGWTAPLAGLGEAGSQLLESSLTGSPKIMSPGAIVTSTGLAAIPGSSAETLGARLLSNGLRYGTAGALAPQVQSLIDTGKPSSATSSVLGGVGGGLLAGAGEMAGAVAGKATGYISPTEQRTMARMAAQAEAGQASPAVQNAQKLLEANGILPPSSFGVSSPTLSPEGLAQKSINGVSRDANQVASVTNEAALRGQVRKQLGLSPNGPLDANAIQQADAKVNATYDKVRALSPEAEKDFAALQKAKAQERALWKAAVPAGPDTGNAFQQLQDQIAAVHANVENLDTMMAAHAAAASDPKLAKMIQDYHKAQDLATQVSAEYVARHSGPAKTLSDSIAQGTRPNRNLTDKELQDTYKAVDQRGQDLWEQIQAKVNPTGDKAQMQLPALTQEVKQAAARYSAARKLEDFRLINPGTGTLDIPSMASRYQIQNGRGNMTGAMEDAAKIGQTFPNATQNPVNFPSTGGSATGVGVGIPTKASLISAVKAPAKAIWGTGIMDRLADPVEQQRLLAQMASGYGGRTSANPALVSSFLKAAQQLSWQRKAEANTINEALFNFSRQYDTGDNQ